MLALSCPLLKSVPTPLGSTPWCNFLWPRGLLHYLLHVLCQTLVLVEDVLLEGGELRGGEEVGGLVHGWRPRAEVGCDAC